MLPAVTQPESGPAPADARYGNLQKHMNPNPLQRRLLARFHQRIVELVCRTGARHILDAGCGEGFTLRTLAEAGIGASKVGVDFSPAAIAWNHANVVTPAPMALSDVRHLPFENAAFDLCLCLEVLEHLPSSEDGLSELVRVSSRYVLVSVPHEPWFRGANFLRGKHVRAFGNDPEHLHNYSGAAFRHMASGFAEVLWHGYSFPWQIALLQK